MASESIVYGCIKDDFRLHGDIARYHHNRAAIAALPAARQWHYLSQEMFALPSQPPGDGYFQSGIIHFGACYRAIEYEWNQWMGQFEGLLEQLYWVSAVVHLETELYGNHTFTWASPDDGHQPGDDVQGVRREWCRESLLV